MAMVSGVICGAYMAAAGVTSYQNAEQYLIRDTELILDLVKQDCKWGECDYMLHALLFALRKKEISELLSRMSESNIAFLKEAISEARKYKCPDKEAADRLNLEYLKKTQKPTISPYDKYKYNILRYSALIASKIASEWDSVIAELDKWEANFENKECVIKSEPETVNVEPDKPLETPKKKVSVKSEVNDSNVEDEKLLSVAELTKQLGFKTVAAFYCKKSEFLNKHGEYKEVFDDWFGGVQKGKKRRLFKAKHLEELRQLIKKPVEKKPNPDILITSDGEFWAMKKLAHEFGVKTMSFFAKKSEFLKRHPEAKEQFDKWFVVLKPGSNRILFKAKHFEELKQLMSHHPERAHSSVVSTPDGELWTTEKLAKELGLKDAMSFLWKKSDFLRKHPEAQKEFDKWFYVSREKSKHLVFRAKYLQDLKNIFKQYSGQNIGKKLKNNSVKPEAKQNIEVEQSVETIEVKGKAEVEEQLLESVETADNQTQNIEQPTDLVGIKGLEAYLYKLQNMLSQVQSNQKQAEAEYEDLLQKANAAKEKAENAKIKAEKLQANISTADGLLKEYTKSETDLRAAEQVMNQKTAQINQFLQNCIGLVKE